MSLHRFQAFVVNSFPTCHPLGPRRVRASISSSATTPTLAFAVDSTARHSQYPRNPFHAGDPLRGFHGSPICYGLPVCLPPCTDPTSFPAVGDFYVQAFGGSVILPAAGYDYSSGWTPLLVGLSPTGTTTSLAARTHWITMKGFRYYILFTGIEIGRATL